ncbi:MAG: PRD domain-containing protein [Corynebacterium sp.]|nr:PRD domain-containing protein [Corynebacterium sp.]
MAPNSHKEQLMDAAEVLRVLNNNAVLCTSVAGPAILLGKGIGFGKKLGDAVDPTIASEIFRPSTAQPLEQLSAMINAIDLEYVELAAEIIRSSNLGYQVPQTVLFAIADHVSFVIQRAKARTSIDNPLHWEIAHLYPQEYQAGQHALALIQEHHDLELPPQEAATIAMHFVTAQFQVAEDTANDDAPIMNATMTMTQHIQTILGLVQDCLGREIPLDSLEATRFITHLRYLFIRLHNPQRARSFSAGISETIATNFPDSYLIAERIRTVLTLAGFELDDDEVAYVAMHIARLQQQLASNTEA